MMLFCDIIHKCCILSRIISVVSHRQHIWGWGQSRCLQRWCRESIGRGRKQQTVTDQLERGRARFRETAGESTRPLLLSDEVRTQLLLSVNMFYISLNTSSLTHSFTYVSPLIHCAINTGIQAIYSDICRVIEVNSRLQTQSHCSWSSEDLKVHSWPLRQSHQFCLLLPFRHSPDVVLLQELIQPYVRFMKNRLAASYTFIEGTCEKVKKVTEQNSQQYKVSHIIKS